MVWSITISMGPIKLIDDLHECRVTASYDKILRFWSSSAQYTRSQPFSSRGFQMDAGALSAWVDNYDLNIFTLNGCRGTHALATEVTQHSLPTNENRQQPLPKIPRLKKKETSRMDIVELPSNALHHYQGPSRPLPPMFPDHDGVPFTEASKKMRGSWENPSIRYRMASPCLYKWRSIHGMGWLHESCGMGGKHYFKSNKLYVWAIDLCTTIPSWHYPHKHYVLGRIFQITWKEVPQSCSRLTDLQSHHADQMIRHNSVEEPCSTTC